MHTYTAYLTSDNNTNSNQKDKLFWMGEEKRRERL